MPDTAVDVTCPAETHAVAEFLARSSVDPCALVVEGEAGIGKTTFWLAAIKEALAQGHQVLSARPAAAETVLAHAALADLLADVESDTWTNLPEPQRRAIDRIMLRATEHTAAVDRRTVAAAFLAVVEELAERRSVVLAIDDLQWLDPSSASVIAYAAIVGSGGNTGGGPDRTDR